VDHRAGLGVLTGEISLANTGIRTPDSQARGQVGTPPTLHGLLHEQIMNL
jgi:hypothetical protein